MYFLKRKTGWVLIGVIVGVILSLGSGVLAEKPMGAPQASPDIPFKELRAFSEVFGRIKSSYVEPVEDKELLENAIKGMLTGLDPHSTYLDVKGFKSLREGTSGEFGGLGIEVTMEDGFVKVVSPIDDTPAAKAGLQAGDFIVRLDDVPVKGMTLGEAVDIMRGKPDTDIDLLVAREGEEPFTVTITRAIIKVQSVRNRMLEDGYGYLRISTFQHRTGENVREAIAEMQSESDGELKGLVLDLRNNPGGLLQAAVEVSDAFVKKGLLVYTEGRIDDSSHKFKAKPVDLLHGAPMVVLVNAGSASASEIVAGALQDHKRAVIMGNQTFGKGSVQTIMPLTDETAVKITTARYFTPSGRSIQAEGITPDIELTSVKFTEAEKSQFERTRERDLTGHIGNGDKEEEKPKASEADKADDVSDEDEAENLAITDYPLLEALNLLKGINVFK
jgi:carboxyl-terminal processing protease